MYLVFNKYSNRYEQWFEQNMSTYESEIEAVREFIPENGRGMEVGIGTGRFSLPFSIKEGVEPSDPMRKIAIERGLHPMDGVGEKLPYQSNEFDFVLMVTTICFVEDQIKCFREAWRVLKMKGLLIVGIVNKSSFLGKQYEQIRDKNVFYRDAQFYSADEVADKMVQTGFGNIEFRQTIFQNPSFIKKLEPVKTGHGEGAFVVIRGIKEPKKP